MTPADAEHLQEEEEEDRREEEGEDTNCKETARSGTEDETASEWEETASRCQQTWENGEVKGAEREDAVSRQTESRQGWVEGMEDIKIREGRQTEDQPCVERSIQVLDNHIPVGSVQWKQARAKVAAGGVQV